MLIERVSPDDQDTFKELVAFLTPMAAEVAIVPVDPAGAAAQGWHTIAEGNTFIARADNGKIAGTIAMTRGNYWYAPERGYLIDRWFYVGHDYRFALVGPKLLRAVRDLAEPLHEAAIVRVLNPSRRQRDDAASFHASIVGWVPVGHETVIRRAQREAVAETAH